MNNDSLYLPDSDRVIFLPHIRVIEVRRFDTEIAYLAVVQDNNFTIHVDHPHDIETFCERFNIPLKKKIHDIRENN